MVWSWSELRATSLIWMYILYWTTSAFVWFTTYKQAVVFIFIWVRIYITQLVGKPRQSWKRLGFPALSGMCWILLGSRLSFNLKTRVDFRFQHLILLVFLVSEGKGPNKYLKKNCLVIKQQINFLRCYCVTVFNSLIIDYRYLSRLMIVNVKYVLTFLWAWIQRGPSHTNRVYFPQPLLVLRGRGNATFGMPGSKYFISLKLT